MDQRLIVGLGNPGRRFQDTWHNAGSKTVEELARRWQIEFKPGKGDFFYAHRLTASVDTVLLIPTSFMNLSGTPVSGWIRYNRIKLEDTLVIFDDHDIPFGRMRIRPNGSSGGHRGLEDIILKLGSIEIPRLRIGIQIDGERPDLAQQVLSKIPPRLRDDFNLVISTAADVVERIIAEGLTSAMNCYNGLEILKSS